MSFPPLSSPSQLAWLFMGLLVGVQGLNCKSPSTSLLQKCTIKNAQTNCNNTPVGSVQPFSLDFKPQIVMVGPEQVAAHRSLLWKVGQFYTTLHSPTTTYTYVQC